MARKSSSGQFIISAGEVGDFCFCPESWRLRHTSAESAATPDSTTASPSSDKNLEAKATGETLHAQWANSTDELLFLAQGAKLLVGLTLVVIFVFEVLHRWL